MHMAHYAILFITQLHFNVRPHANTTKVTISQLSTTEGYLTQVAQVLVGLSYPDPAPVVAPKLVS
jgi:hypothetical protein